MVSIYRYLFAAAALVGLGYGCAGLIPVDLKYETSMIPVLPEGRGDYQADPDSGTVTFSVEGALVTIKYMDDDALNERIPKLFDGRHVNPYTFEKKDPEKRFIPPRFTVFEVTVDNETYAKIQFDPAFATLHTDKGDELRYYDPGRAGEGVDVLGGNRFSQYYETELGRSGLDKDLNLERIGVVYRSAFHRDRPVFRGDERSGLLAFPPLDDSVASVRLVIGRFVLSFDADNNPVETVDIEYNFKVEQGAVKVEKTEG